MLLARHMIVVGHRLLLLAVFNCMCSFSVATGYWQATNSAKVAPFATGGLDLTQRLNCFNPLEPAAGYSISLCADLPDNNHPDKVYVKKETGHVFLILKKTDPDIADSSMAQVFGFYPVRPVSSIIFKNVRCEMLDNGNREYNAVISKELTAKEFALILQKAKELTAKKYNINKYNCYDYALNVFNSIPGIEKLPVTHVKFPFIFGRGGSPCGLYRDLEKLKVAGSTWAPFIQFGVFTSPASYKSK
jgi:hypothetical protein